MSQAHDTNFPQTSSGAWYPKNHVVGVIDDLSEAQQALQAFKQAGYQSEELRLMDSQETAEKSQELEEKKNPLQRFLSGFQDHTDETGAMIYQVEARKGGHILYVHAGNDQEVEKIAALMQKYHAHTVKYFGPWSVADIPQQDTSIH